MQRFESSRPGWESWASCNPRCRGSNPAAPTGQSVSNAYGIGSRSKCPATLLEMRMFDFSRPGLRVFSEFDSEMQWFESSRPSQPVRLKRVKYEGRSKTARYREVSQWSILPRVGHKVGCCFQFDRRVHGSFSARYFGCNCRGISPSCRGGTVPASPGGKCCRPGSASQSWRAPAPCQSCARSDRPARAEHMLDTSAFPALGIIGDIIAADLHRSVSDAHKGMKPDNRE